MGDVRYELAINGMHCDACVALIKDALTGCAGVRSVEAAVGRAEIVGDDAEVTLSALVGAVGRAGAFTIQSFRRT